MLTRDIVLEVFKNAQDVDAWVEGLNKAFERFGLTSDLAISSFLAIVGNETGGLQATTEDFNYSYARAAQVWPGKAGPVMQDRINKGPEAFAKWIYAGILGNGDEASGDGLTYGGKGLIGITGKLNYKNTGDGIGVDLVSHPELIMTPEIGALAAVWFCVELIKIKPNLESADENVFIRGANRVGTNNNPEIAQEITTRRLTFRRNFLKAFKKYQSYEKKPDGNVLRKDIKESQIVKDANKGQVIASAGAAAGAAAPVVQAWLGAEWKTAASFGVVVVILCIAAMIYFKKNKKRRIEMHKENIA